MRGGASFVVVSVEEAIREACEAFRASGIEGGRLDAEVLLAFALGKSRAWLYGNGDAPLRPGETRCFRDMVQKRGAREPLAYVIEEKEFFGLSFLVAPSVFIPRPETEGIVDRLCRIRLREGGERLVDACTGAGNIAVAAYLCAGYPKVAATEIHAEALELGKRNAERLKAVVEFHLGDLLVPLLGTDWEGKADVVCANPPYVRSCDLPALPKEVRREPAAALDGGPDGLDLFRRLVAQTKRLLRPGGVFLAEIGEDQGRAAMAAAEGAGLVDPVVERDLAGLDRYLLARKCGWRNLSSRGESP